MIQLILVEDDQDDQDFLIEALQSIQMINISTAVDGVELLTLLQQDPLPLTDLIVMDLLLPRKDGFETLVAIKSDTRLSHIPIIILTTSILDEERCLNAGCTKYFLKPASMEGYRILANDILNAV